jgi:hypothetical protein
MHLLPRPQTANTGHWVALFLLNTPGIGVMQAMVVALVTGD